ncbi:acyl carrier protein [Aspergillus niger CBS 101883]|uniref:acyl carrier protein n=1 Tax=Aspergillus lacticoffeatus (strain CBS 101883) TaxID=1450533 RepID=UPI000D7EEF4E|nr:acyl carrier protein [Aspergillus niger CBS 101883]PYH51809.1 acyl carrier protein [Aspergillus niger CBS 101883]
MFRSAVVRSLRASVPRAVKTPAPFQIRSSPVARPAQFAPRFAYQGVRLYSAPAGLNKDEVEGRIVNLLKNFDKVRSQSRINGASHFANDLGLDSLDTVEVVMAIEEEFSIEIPDKEADSIHSVDKAVEYILGQPDGKCNTLACAIEFILRGFSTDYSASSLNMNVMRGLGVDWGT